jgi:hypothetical protein
MSVNYMVTMCACWLFVQRKEVEKSTFCLFVLPPIKKAEHREDILFIFERCFLIPHSFTPRHPLLSPVGLFLSPLLALLAFCQG